MTIREAVNQFLEFHEANSKPATLRCYTCLLRGFQEVFGDKSVEEITSADVLAFLIPRTEDLKQATKSHKLTMPKSFFNFCIHVLEVAKTNPCDASNLKKRSAIHNRGDG